MVMIVIYSYTTTLMSYMTVRKLEPIPNSLEELTNNRSFEFTIDHRSIFVEYIMVQNVDALFYNA